TNVYAYNGYGVTLDLKIEGQASKSDFNFAYYRNATETLQNKMGSVPVEVGTYLVVITAKSSSNVALSGNTKFVFTIEPAVIEINWNENAKPPVLSLAYGQINGVEYEIRDGDNNPVASFGTTTPTGTYGIRAKIKTGQEKNFIFDNGKTTTEWVEFNYTQGTTVYDPNSPDNPFYPQTPSEQPDAPSDDTTTPPDGSNKPTDPDDPTNPSDGDDKDGNGTKETLTKIKEFLEDYWQVIVSGVALFLALIFIGKGLSYASKRKKIKKQIKKNYTPAYAIALYTAGEKLWNIDYKIWTILAFTLLGVAVLAFVFMLLEKRGFKKAQEELESAKLEYARNPMAYATAGANAQPRNQEASAEEGKSNKRKDREIERLEEELRKRDEEYRRFQEENRRRDEEMKMMFMSMMGGVNGNANQQYDASGNPQFVKTGGGTNIIIDAEHIKTMITETVAALLPSVQALLPQQASSNDEMVKLLVEEIKDNKEESRKNDERLEKLITKLIEKDGQSVAASTTNNVALEQMMRNQEKLIERLLERDEQKGTASHKVVEKVVEKPVEKVV
ncbi:MAG: hypothetical protein K2G37_02340, partial [Clostridia bacterium]|nr:hypothetical protein [Clostridia bacterium]